MKEGKMVASVAIDGNSPWFSGHFPDNPILPGIAQLKMVADLISTSGEGNLCLTGVTRVKFRKIVKPGEVLDINVTSGNKKDQYIFKITSGDQDVCSGWMFFTLNETVKRTNS
ncbi:MAG: 3-hydroxyacyl-[acyl-carrier-protein] dehydratase [Desulforhopalus sp.]|jgi:3-hydroxyacyl-[acyl-carrier-protein] dehydratase